MPSSTLTSTNAIQPWYGPSPSAPTIPGTGFNLNPTPNFGSGTAQGEVPGPLGLPNPAGDLAAQVPGLASLNKTASNDILSNLSGTLSPGTLAALQNAAATYGETSGMPGSGLSWNSLYGNIAGASTAQQALGLQQLNPFLSQTSNTQTVNPALQTQIAATNATNAAAPDPAMAASYAQQLFNQYLQAMKGPQGGTGGSGNPALDQSGASDAGFNTGPLPPTPDTPYYGGTDATDTGAYPSYTDNGGGALPQPSYTYTSGQDII